MMFARSASACLPPAEERGSWNMDKERLSKQPIQQYHIANEIARPIVDPQRLVSIY